MRFGSDTIQARPLRGEKPVGWSRPMALFGER
jgi:hypothetical protein